MAYYDPSSDREYYNPYNYQSDPGPGLMSAAGNAAKMMFVMGALNLGGQAIARGISKTIGRTIKNNAKAPFHQIARKMTEPTIGGILKRTTVGTTTRRIFRSTPLARAAAQRRTYLKNFKIAHPDKHGVERIVSAFKDPKTLVASVGGAWARNAVAGAGVSYAVDSMFGITQELGLEQKKIYDIPGQAGNFLKWFGYESIYSTAFGGIAGPIAGAVGSIGKRAVNKAFGGKFGKSLISGYSKFAKPGIPTEKGFQRFFKESVLADAHSQQEKAFSSRSAVKGLGWGRTVRETSSQINAAFRQLPGSIKEGLKHRGTTTQKIKKSLGPVTAAIKNARDIQIKNRSPRHQFSPAKYTGLRAVQFLERLGDQAAKGGQFQTKQSMDHYLKMMRPEFDKLEKKGIVDYAFKFLKPLRNRDVVDPEMWNRIEGNLSSRYAKSHVQELVKTVKNMRGGQRVYKGYGHKIKGAGVDLSAFDPLLTAKRGLEKLMNTQFNIPFSQSAFSFGSITRLNKYFAEAPSLEFFDKGPAFKIRGDSAKKYHGKNITSIGEISTDKDALYFYLNGKWGIFDEHGIETLDSKSKLMYAARNSVEKQGELNSINVDRLKRIGGIAAVNKAIEHSSRGHQFKNKWLNLLQRKTNLSLPERAEHFLNSMADKMRGKNHAYRLAATEVFGSDGFDVNPNALNTLDGILSHTTQDLSRLSKNKRFLEILGEQSGDKYLTKDLFNIVMNNDRLLDAIRSRSLNNAEFWRYNSRAKEAFKMAEAFPKQAEDHISVKRLGPLSEMNSYDILRTSYIDDIFNKDFLQYKSGNGEPHGIINAIPKLVEENIITGRDAKSLKLHAELSSLKDKGLFAYTGEPGRDDVFRKVLKDIRTDKHWKVRQIQSDIIDFVSNTDMRRPRVRVNQEKILQDGIPDYIKDNNPYFSTPNGLLGKAFGDTGYVSNILSSVTNMMQEWYPFRKNPIKHRGILGSINYMATGIATVGAGMMAYRTADFLFASNPLFDETALDQGITGMLADQTAKARLFTQRASDLTGVTGALKYLDGLMPGSESTIPGMIAGLAASKFVGGGPLKALKYMAGGALINRIADPYLPDFSKGYEQLRSEYSGEEPVPFMKSPTWLLGGTPWQGTKVEGYTPNWYVRAKSRWKASETLYGSEFRRFIHEPLPFLGFNVGDIVDPYFMERKHYFSRPFPLTGTALNEVPIVGSILGPTLGRIIKPQKTMHQEFLQGEEVKQGGTDFAITPPSTQEGLGLMSHTPGVRRTAGRAAFQGTFVYTGHKNYGQLVAQDFLERTSQLAGLQGFLGKTIMNKLVGEPMVMPTMESAGRIASMSRSYYDMNLGGLGVMCLPPEEKVLTKDGLKSIKNIKIGDMVYDHEYNLKKVTDTLSRYCDIGESLYTIEIGASKTKIKTTWNHPFAIYRKNKCNNNKSRSCIPSYSKKCLKCSNKNKNIVWEWIKAEDIKIGDFVSMPLPKEKPECSIVDLSFYHDRGITDSFLYFDSSEFGKAYELLENNICKNRNDLREYVDDLIAKEALISFRHNSVRRQDRYLEIDEDFSLFIGWWLAEGSANGKDIKFTLNINEKNIAVKLGNIYKDKFNKSFSIYEYPEKNTCILTLKNKLLSTYLKSFGNVHSKQLKDLINLPDNLSIKLCEGLINGDGWLNHKKQKGGFTSVSERLTRDLWLLLYRLGVQSTILVNYKEKEKGYYPQGTSRKDTIRSYLEFNKNGFNNLLNCFKTNLSNDDISTGRTFTHNGMLFIKIRDITKEDYSRKKVHDITVEDSHCFVSNYALIHNSEGVRRLFVKPDYKKYGLNPIPNMMPNWLPSEYLQGDAYSKIMRGELRLPGKAYLQTHSDVERTLPGRASMIGGTQEHIIQYFTGLLPPILKKEYDILETGTSMHEIIQDHLAAEGLLVQAETLVYDAKNDISGHVDAIVRDGSGGRGKRAMEIKTISDQGFSKLDAPKNQHVGQLNFYLRQLHMKSGTILYVNRDNPSQVKTFEVNYSQNRWEKDLRKLQRARQISADMMQQGVGDTFGHSYSWLDRLQILADVAPGSKEFKEAKSLVEQQIKHNQLDERQLQKYKRILNMRQTRLRKYELYPTRFKGQVLTPDTETNIQSINNNIKAAAEYSLPERAFGAIWENFVNSNSFIVNKFFAFKDPIEHYKNTRLYGKEYKPWDEPVRSFIEPYSRGLISKTDPYAGSMSWGTGGFLLGGPIGGAMGGAIGSLWGTGHGLWRKATNSQYIPSIINDQREIEQYFDRAKYARYDRLAQLTNGLTRQAFIDERNATMTAVSSGHGGISELFRATPFREKPYIEAFLNTKNFERRKEILGLVPDDVALALQNQWAKHDENFDTRELNDRNSEFLASTEKMSRFNKQIFDPSIALEDIKLKTINEAGYDQHEFGLGWNKQMLRMQENYDKIQSQDYQALNQEHIIDTPNISSAQVRGAINNLFSQSGIRVSSNVYINNSDDENYINIEVRRDRSNTIVNAMNNRRYLGG